MTIKVRLVCPSASNNSVATGRIFMKFCFDYFSEMCRENSCFIKSLTGVRGTLHEDVLTFMMMCPNSSYNEKRFRLEL